MAMPLTAHEHADLRVRAQRLGLNGILAHWDENVDAPWLPTLLEHEESERSRRSMIRRIRDAHIGRFKSIADFDWSWPAKIDRDQIDDLLALDFIRKASNVLIIGPNGVGKTMLGQNLAHQAVLNGFTARFTSASELLNDLVAQESQASLLRRLQRATRPQLLVIDEVGYLSYDSRHADLLFEVISRRHQTRSTIVTTNRPFSEWNEVFPNASCVVALVDRLMHHADVIEIQGESYRLKESREREARREAQRDERRAARRASVRTRSGE